MVVTGKTSVAQAPRELDEVAYYHEPYWHPDVGDYFKTLLLFFDGIALLVPEYMRDRPLQADPTLAQPLADQGLLRILSPEDLVDQQVAETIAEVLFALLSDGGIADEPGGPLVELSYSRLGFGADPELIGFLLGELEKRGLAGRSRDGVSVPLRRELRTLILTVLPQLLRQPAEGLGLALQPLTGNPEVHRALLTTLSVPGLPSSGHVVNLDLEPLNIDLSTVPLDEVLDFRTRHGSEYRAYVRDMRNFLRLLSEAADEPERERLLDDRRQAIADQASALVLQRHFVILPVC